MGWKGIAIAFLVRRSVFRAGWIVSRASLGAEELSEKQVWDNNKTKSSPENICTVPSK